MSKDSGGRRGEYERENEALNPSSVRSDPILVIFESNGHMQKIYGSGAPKRSQVGNRFV